MALYYVTASNWENFLVHVLKQYEAYAPTDRNGRLFWTPLSAGLIPTAILSRHRALQSIKPFFVPVSGEVTQEPRPRKVALLGGKACDLRHLETMDRMFQEGAVVDPYYVDRRRNTLIISADCDACLPTCFCSKMGGQPYPTAGFDMNLTLVRAGYVVETGSTTCEELVRTRRHLFQEPQTYHLQERDQVRRRMVQSVRDVNAGFTWDDPRAVVQATPAAAAWKADIASTCVECDACRFVCGTCYCFLLGEGSAVWERIRTWDSCQSAGYGRMAGGGNPRPLRHERLRNFYQCKLVYRHENFGTYACTGCGRCIEVCQGKIDLRRSLQKLHESLL